MTQTKLTANQAEALRIIALGTVQEPALMVRQQGRMAICKGAEVLVRLGMAKVVSFDFYGQQMSGYVLA